MKATTLLERQHRKVKAIFKKLESGRSDPGPLLTELCNDLAAHMAIEQELFYPAIRHLDAELDVLQRNIVDVHRDALGGEPRHLLEPGADA